MAAIANVVLNDGTADQTFIPQSKDRGTTVWAKSGASRDLDQLLITKANYVSGASNRKVKVTLKFPFVSTDLNDKKSLREGFINIELNVPKSMTTTDIAKVRNYAKSAMLNSIIVDMLDNGQNPY